MTPAKLVTTITKALTEKPQSLADLWDQIPNPDSVTYGDVRGAIQELLERGLAKPIFGKNNVRMFVKKYA